MTTKLLNNVNDRTYQEVEYLKKNLGPILVAALAEICIRRPSDPIEYLGHWLLRWRYNEELKRQDVQNAMDVVKQRQWAQVKGEYSQMAQGNHPDQVGSYIPDDLYARGHTQEHLGQDDTNAQESGYDDVVTAELHAKDSETQDVSNAHESDFDDVVTAQLNAKESETEDVVPAPHVVSHEEHHEVTAVHHAHGHEEGSHHQHLTGAAAAGPKKLSNAAGSPKKISITASVKGGQQSPRKGSHKHLEAKKSSKDSSDKITSLGTSSGTQPLFMSSGGYSGAHKSSTSHDGHAHGSEQGHHQGAHHGGHPKSTENVTHHAGSEHKKGDAPASHRSSKTPSKKSIPKVGSHVPHHAA